MCGEIRCDLLCTGYVFLRALIGGKNILVHAPFSNWN